MNRFLKYRLKNKHKTSAQVKLREAVKKGIINKPNQCSRCLIVFTDKSKLQGHHEDYNKPYEVIWVCPKCHSAIHNKGGEGHWCAKLKNVDVLRIRKLCELGTISKAKIAEIFGVSFDTVNNINKRKFWKSL